MILSQDDTAFLREAARVADTEGRLQPAQHERITRGRWLHLLTPRALGGLETDLPAAVRWEESLAAADGSVGWLVTLCAGAGWFLGFLPQALAALVAATPAMCLAGSGATTGIAGREGEGWRVNGRWRFASGAPWATHFTFNAVLHESGQALADAQGKPRQRSFIVPASEVQIEYNWRAMGLRASDSQGFAIQDAWVPGEQSFDVGEGPRVEGALYRFSFAGLAYATLAANVAGMAQGFLREARPLLDYRATHGRSDASAARSAFEAARTRFYQVLDAAWAQNTSLAGGCDEAALREASLAWVAAARAAVDAVYPLCGLRATDMGGDLNRLWRDVQTGAQHAYLAP